MKRYKYLENNLPIIYLLASPIGNLDEINQRFINTINEVDTIYCEDTRVTSKLLNHLNIKNKKLISFHKHNEFERQDLIIKDVLLNKKIAIISDAGYPLLSDPGLSLVKEAIKQDINIVTINGSNALLPALLSSSFNTIPFTFIGFIPHKKNDALNYLNKFKDYYHTIVLYESIHRLNKTLSYIYEIFDNIEISISRELTKLNEEHIYGNVKDIIDNELALKGELVICLNNIKKEIEVIDDDILVKEVNDLVNDGLSKKDAIKEITNKYDIEKNYLYDIAHQRN